MMTVSVMFGLSRGGGNESSRSSQNSRNELHYLRALFVGGGGSGSYIGDGVGLFVCTNIQNRKLLISHIWNELYPTIRGKIKVSAI